MWIYQTQICRNVSTYLVHMCALVYTIVCNKAQCLIILKVASDVVILN